jgi:SAM-dependent methyltransferase
MSVFVLKYWTTENAASPEFRYLHSLQLDRLRAVFGSVQLALWRPGLQSPRFDATDYALVLGDANVWFTRSTLGEMKAAIDAGAAWVAPGNVNDRVAGLEPVYTARDFEQLEAILARTSPAGEMAGSQIPVSLLSHATCTEYASRAPLSTLLTHESALSNGGIAGVYLRFPDYYGETREDLLPFLPDRIGDMLEIGCGRGTTARLIQERFGCRVTGIERHPDVAADAARHLARVIVGDVESASIDGTYDVILASELIEHVSDPELVLEKLRKALRPAGRIVLSVPNVGHYSVVEDLLAGRWDYVPAGLLCYTHLRFFTRTSLTEWASRLGFDCEIHPQLTELPSRFATIPAALAPDRESLRTKGFYVILTSRDNVAAQ